MALFNQYMYNIQHCQHDHTYQSSYLQMVHVLLTILRATSEGDWELHLITTLSWFFVYDRVNYARYLTIY
jgi:hypothetical protein